MTQLRTLEDLGDVHGAAVLVRVDFNVPIEDGRVMDDTRLTGTLPTLRALAKRGARLALVSHRGRPKGSPDPGYSLKPVAERLAQLMEEPVAFAPDCVGEAAAGALAGLPPGGACLLENVRFHAGETANDPDFARRLAELAEVYVSDAFGTAHRAHASTVGAAELLPRRAAGRLLATEVEVLGRLLEAPERPFVAIVGGAKIAGKADTLVNLLPRLDKLVLGGAMANTFLAATGHDLGRSLVERDRIELARTLLARAEARGVEVVLPRDFVAADDLDAPREIVHADADDFPSELMAVDIGERSRRDLAAAVADARTVFWNGPLGVFEREAFAAGTLAAALVLAECAAKTVIGGGETVAAVNRSGVAGRMHHISTGGGAALELLAGKTLPGVAVLEVSS